MSQQRLPLLSSPLLHTWMLSLLQMAPSLNLLLLLEHPVCPSPFLLCFLEYQSWSPVSIEMVMSGWLEKHVGIQLMWTLTVPVRGGLALPL